MLGWVRCGAQDMAGASELKRIIEGLPLETSAVAGVEWRLGQLDPPHFAALLTELARDNHAFRCAAHVYFLPSFSFPGTRGACQAEQAGGLHMRAAEGVIRKMVACRPQRLACGQRRGVRSELVHACAPASG